MVETYVLNDIQEGCFISEATDYERKNTDIDDQYVKLEDFKKLQEVFIDMTLCYQCEDILGAPSYEDIQNEYKKLIGEFTLDDLHKSIIQPVIKRCKNKLKELEGEQ